MLRHARLSDDRGMMLLLSIFLLSLHLTTGTLVPSGSVCRSLGNNVTVDCSSRGLLTVPPISDRVIHLDLGQNRLQMLSNGSFSGLSDLQVLRMSDNNLTTVGPGVFCGLSGLRVLDLSRNRLSALTLGDNECSLLALQELLLSENLLTQLPPTLATSTPQLQTLNFSINLLSSAALDGLSNLRTLTTLDLHGNHIYEIQTVDLEPLATTALRELNLAENKLYRLEATAFCSLTSLESLSLAQNSLSLHTLQRALQTLSNASRLVHLDLRDMVLMEVTVALLRDFSHLRELRLSDSDVTRISPDVFDQLPALESLDVAHNTLTGLENLQAAKKLRHLDASHNQLTNISISSLAQLEDLNLSYNKFQSLPAAWLSLSQSLQLVNVSHNSITAITSDYLQNASIQTLDLSHNALNQIPSVAGLRKLYVSHNSLEFLTPKTFLSLGDQLEDLDLSYNDLSAVGGPLFPGTLPSLQELNLAGNPLGAVLEQGGLSPYLKAALHLRKLDLSDMGLEKVGRDQLYHLHHLTTLDVSRNRVRELAGLRLGELDSLAKLLLAENSLVVVDVAVLRGLEDLEEVDLSQNPFSCQSCEVAPLLDWINSSGVLVLGHRSYLCQTPPSLGGEPITASQPCLTPRHPPHTRLDWAMVAVAIVGATVFLTLTALLVFYTQICHKLKTLHYRWQVRYREVSGVEFSSEPRV